jgi:hypothetical protein
MCNIEFTPTGKLKNHQLFCDKVCFSAWLQEIEREEKVFHMYNTPKTKDGDTIQ